MPTLKKQAISGTSAKLSKASGSVAAPQIPQHLKQSGAQFWRTVSAEFNLPQDLLAVLEQACIALDRAEEAAKILKSEGLVSFNRFNEQRPHAMLNVERDFRTLFLKSVKALNLAPALDAELAKLGKARA